MTTYESHTAVVRELITAPLLVELLDEYLAHLRGKGRRPRGIQKYRDQYLLIARALGPDATVADLTEDRITTYRDQRAAQVAASTLFNELCVIRSMCKWCVRKRYLADDPTKYVDYPKLPKPNPRALKRTQLKQLFTIIDTEPDTFKATWRRNRLLLLLLVYTGLRIAEAAGLRWGDVDLDANTIKVRPDIAKNGRTRAIPIHPRLKEELSRIENQEADRPVIAHAHDDSQAMDAKGLGKIFERWLNAKGLDISAHQLRHTLATELLRAGAPLPDIQAILGHESLETTAVYLTTDSDWLRGAMGLLPAGW
jgi:integrase/recombinase XerD